MTGCQAHRQIVRFDDYGLTPRELQVAEMLSSGASNKQIAQSLVLVLATVKAHVSSVMAKTLTHNRTETALLLTPYFSRSF